MLPFAATCYFRAVRRVHFPIRVEVGEYLSVWVGAGQNLRVIDGSGETVLRRGDFPEGKLWTALLDLVLNGAIEMLASPEVSLSRLPQRRVAQSRAASRKAPEGGALVSCPRSAPRPRHLRLLR